MQNNTDNTAIIEAATAAIAAAALDAATAILAAKAKLTLVIRDQSALLRKAGVTDVQIARIVREAVAGSVTPSHISRTLVACGIRLRGKRSDAGSLRLADGALDLCREPKPDKPEASDGEPDCLVEDGTKGSGHTAETLASLLASIDPEIVREALEIAGLA